MNDVIYFQSCVTLFADPDHIFEIMLLNNILVFLWVAQITWWLALALIFIAVILVSGTYRSRKRY